MGAPGGARGPPTGGPERPTNPQGSANHDGNDVFWKCHRNTHLENVHPSLAPGLFWPNRDADRSLITRVGCVFRCGPKNGRGGPKGRGGGLERTEKNNVSKNVHPSRAPGPFGQNRDADRTLITTVGCVFCCGRKSGHGSPRRSPWASQGGPGEAHEPPRER